jgi:Photosystem I psaA/psaB protein
MLALEPTLLARMNSFAQFGPFRGYTQSARTTNSLGYLCVVAGLFGSDLSGQAYILGILAFSDWQALVNHHLGAMLGTASLALAGTLSNSVMALDLPSAEFPIVAVFFCSGVHLMAAVFVATPSSGYCTTGISPGSELFPTSAMLCDAGSYLFVEVGSLAVLLFWSASHLFYIGWLAHHGIALGLHVTTLILLKAALNGRNISVLPGKVAFQRRVPL